MDEWMDRSMDRWMDEWMDGWFQGSFGRNLEKRLTVTEKYYPFLVNTQTKVLYDDRIYTNYGFHINHMEIF